MLRAVGIRRPFKGTFYWEWQICRTVFQVAHDANASHPGFSRFRDPHWRHDTIFETF